MGITQLETLESYKINNANAFTEEETHVIALDPKIMA